jgi:hypothetical protein
MVGRGEHIICSQALDIHTRIPGLKTVAWISAGQGKRRAARLSGQPRLRLKEGTESHRTGFIYSLDDCRLDDFEWSGTDQRRDLSNLFQYERSLSKQGAKLCLEARCGQAYRNTLKLLFKLSCMIRLYKAFSSLLA